MVWIQISLISMPCKQSVADVGVDLLRKDKKRDF
jgi:hypothetical protein